MSIKNKRIRLINSDKRLDSFYKSITNSKESGRGKEMILITHKTFSKIAEIIPKLQYKNLGKYYRFDIAQLLTFIVCGARFTELNLPVPRRVLSSYLKEAVELLALDTQDRSVTLNTLYTSGNMIRVAETFNFDIEYECQIYNIPMV